MANTSSMVLARNYISSGRFTSAVRLLEPLVANPAHQMESRILLLRIWQDSYLRSKRKSYRLAAELGRIDDEELLLNGEPFEPELRLRYLQLTLSPMKSASAIDKRRPHTADRILKKSPSHPVALMERAIESYMLNQQLKTEYYARSALRSDSRSHPAYLMLFRMFAVFERFAELDSLAIQMQSFIPESPYGWSMAGYSAYQQKDLERAEMLFQVALEHMTYDLRRSYIDATPYFRDDVAGESDQDSVAFSLNYWTKSDPLHLTPVNERMVEHFARLTYADLYYSDVYADQIGWETHRGQFIVRYGVPDKITRDQRQEYKHSVYETGLGPGGIPLDASKMFDPFPGSKTEMRVETWSYEGQTFRFFDEWWTGSFPLYTPSAASPGGKDDLINARSWFYREPFRTSYRVPGAQLPLTFVATRLRAENIARDRAPGDEMDVIVALGVPVSYRPHRGSLSSPVRIGSFLTGLRGGMAGRYTQEFEILESYAMISLDDVTFWSHANTLRVPAGDNYALSVEYQSLPSAAVYGVERTDLAPLTEKEEDGGPAVSDLLLCYFIEEGLQNPDYAVQGFQRYGYEMFPAPDVLFYTGDPLYVYFEAYDLSAGTTGQSTFKIEAVLVPAEKKRGGVSGLFASLMRRDQTAAVSVSFNAEGRAPIVPYYLLLDTKSVIPGDYDLAIQITDDVTGKTASSMRTITLQ